MEDTEKAVPEPEVYKTPKEKRERAMFHLKLAIILMITCSFLSGFSFCMAVINRC